MAERVQRNFEKNREELESEIAIRQSQVGFFFYSLAVKDRDILDGSMAKRSYYGIRGAKRKSRDWVCYDRKYVDGERGRDRGGD